MFELSENEGCCVRWVCLWNHHVIFAFEIVNVLFMVDGKLIM